VPADDSLELEFPAEHKESLASLWVSKNKDGVLWSFRPEAEVEEEQEDYETLLAKAREQECKELALLEI
jgi:hypothetical protein